MSVAVKKQEDETCSGVLRVLYGFAAPGAATMREFPKIGDPNVVP